MIYFQKFEPAFGFVCSEMGKIKASRKTDNFGDTRPLVGRLHEEWFRLQALQVTLRNVSVLNRSNQAYFIFEIATSRARLHH